MKESARGATAPEADAREIAALAQAHARVVERIAEACARAGRNPADVTLVAVSKTVTPRRLLAAVAAGIAILGENRVQEAADKIPFVPGATWHLVGPLQSNKARRAVEFFDTVETVDSLGIARRLDLLAAEVRPNRPLPVLLQVNVDADPAKAGYRPSELEADLAELGRLGNLRLEGLMTIGRLVARSEEARPTFGALRALGERLRAIEPRLGPGLSMGMTDDFEVAVEEGATHVRVGRAIFGERPHPD